MKAQDKNLLQKGFTLVELLVVIVILGVLAAVVVFAVGGITNTSKASACKIEVRTINTATQAFYANSTATPQAYPAGPTVALMLGQLVSANLMTSAPATGASYSPTQLGTYVPATGVYSSAICP